MRDNTLTTKATLQAGVDRPVNEVLLLVGDFLQVFLSFFDVHMAGGAGAHPAAVVVQVHVVFFGNFQNRLVQKISADGFRRDGCVLKLKCNGGHLKLSD